MDDNFEIGYELSDYGKLRYEFDDSLGTLDMSKQGRNAMLKNPRTYYFAVVILFLLSWFIASFISNSIKHGFFVSLGLHASGFFALFVMSLIIIFSFGGFWGKFVRWSAEKKIKAKEFVNREDQREDFINSFKNALQIYKDWVVIVENRQSVVLDISKIKKVKLCYASDYEKQGYNAIFYADNNKFKISRAILPLGKTTLIQFKKIFREKLEIENSVKNVREQRDLRSCIAPLLFVSLAIFAGIGVIVMHFKVSESIPIFLGAFFIFGGVLLICGILSFVSILKDVVMPLLVGVLFLFFPYMLLYTIFNANDIALTFKTFFEVFNVFGAAVFFFGSLGLMFVYDAIKMAICYVVYRDKK